MSLISAIGSYATATTLATGLPASFTRQRDLDDYAVLVIDMQPHYLDFTIDHPAHLISNQATVLEFCKSRGLPIIILKTKYHGDIVPELKDVVEDYRNKELIEKIGPNGFVDTNLEPVLQERNVKRLIAMGVYSAQCFFTTINGVVARKINVLTAEDLISGWYSEKELDEKRSREWIKRNTDCYKGHTKLLETITKL